MKKFLAIAASVALMALIGVGILKLNLGAPFQSEGAFRTQVQGPGTGMAINPATTTPCAFLVTATSSINHFSVNVTTGTSSAGTLILATSTSPNATTSPIGSSFVIGANAQQTWTWNGGVNNDVVSPNTWVVLGMTNGSAVSYGYTYGGRCALTLFGT